MVTVAYFIGGPLDLTKTAIQRAESRMYALSMPAFTLSEVGTAQDYDRARELIETRHVYRRLCAEGRDTVVYVYEKQESSHG